MGKSCVFCGAKGSLSKEHLWPNWLSKMYLRKGDEKHFFGSKTFMDRELLRDGTYERPGHLFSIKNRVVCQDCNNGWMSEVENEAKPVILKLITGKKCKIPDHEVNAFSFWVTMKIVTAEFIERNEDLHVTPIDERQSMMLDKKMPPYFSIFIGRHSTDHNSAWLRHSWTMAYSPKGPQPPLNGRQRNSQSIAFMIGPVFVYALNVRLLGFVPEEHFRFGNLLKIWPSKKRFIRWPTQPLKRVETDVIAYMSADLTESDHTVHIPDMPRD